MQMYHGPLLNCYFRKDSTDPERDFWNDLQPPTLQSKDSMTRSHVTKSRSFPEKDWQDSNSISDLQASGKKSY